MEFRVKKSSIQCKEKGVLRVSHICKALLSQNIMDHPSTEF